MTRLHFPPDNPADAGPVHRSRLYERVADLLPVVTYAALLWCVTVYLLIKTAPVLKVPTRRRWYGLSG